MIINILPPPQLALSGLRKGSRLGKACGIAVIALASATSPSCVDKDYEIPQSELYAREFVKNYGISSPGHTYSMARSVRATVSVERPCSGTMEIYSDVPGSAEARLLATIPFDGKSTTADFDVEAGTSSVFVRVIDNVNTVRYASRMAINGLRAKAQEESGEIFGAANASDLQKNEFSYNAYRMNENALNYLWSRRNELKTYTDAAEHYKAEYDANPDYNKPTDLDVNGVQMTIPNLYTLDNLKNVYGQEFYWKELKPMFLEYVDFDGSKQTGAFAEGIDHINQYYLNPTGSLKLDPEVTFNVLNDGPVTMQCIWRGTQYQDYYGYYYFPEGKELTPEELWNLPKYIFLTPNEITVESDLTQMAEHTIKSHTVWNPETNQNDLIIDGEEWSEWKNLTGMGVNNCNYWPETDNRMFRGKKYTLAYFGENYDQPASYDFPKGVQIGYFLISSTNIFFSDCALNYYLINQKYYGTNANPESADGPTARPFAAKYTYDKHTYVGFGDMSGDCDLNDVVFIASNVYPTPEDITPEVIKPKPQTWTLACEDLGSTDDFDFNDIVIDIEYVKGSKELTLIPRAAGGTLDSDIYFDNKKLGEIHNLLGATPGAMTNTGLNYIDPATVSHITVTVDEEWQMSQAEGGFADLFRIFTHKADSSPNGNEGTWLQSVTDLGNGVVVPQMLLLRGGWKWPRERVNIHEAYGNFGDWVRDAEDFDWDTNKTEHHLIEVR